MASRFFQADIERLNSVWQEEQAAREAQRDENLSNATVATSEEAVIAAKEVISVNDSSSTTIVTASARELIATLLTTQPMYAVLHISEPTPTDPLASIVRMTGSYAVPVTWMRHGSVIANSVPLQFAGITDLSSVNWVALTSDPEGTQILFTGEVEEPETAGTQFDVFIVPVGAIELIIA